MKSLCFGAMVALLCLVHGIVAEEALLTRSDRNTGVLVDRRAASLEISRRERALNCNCVGSTCSCCRRITYNKFSFSIDDDGCLKVVQSGDTYSVTLTLGAKTLYEETLPMGTVAKPCVDLKLLVKVCLDLYDVSWEVGKFGGCGRARVTVFGFELERIELGCFQQ